MKQFVAFILFFICATIQVCASETIHFPKYGYSTIPQFRIDSIAKTSTNTIVYCHLNQ